MVVDDDRTLADVVGRYLIRDGHQVECVHDGLAALRRIEEEPPDLVVLDLMLPGVGGLEVCRQLGSRWPIPVVMLTALGEETDKIAGFEIGADDYMTKPFSPRELALRVRSVLRRARGGGLLGAPSQGVIADGDLAVDLGAHEASLGSAAGRAHLARIRPAGLPDAASAGRRSPGSSCLSRCGTGRSATPRRSPCTSAGSGRSWKPIRPCRTRIATVWGVGYRYEPEAA